MTVSECKSVYGNPILEKSLQFGVRVVKYYLFCIKHEYQIKDLLKQLLRSGTSIGANVAESQEAVSKKDFINKLSIALKEARETEYWLKLLKESSLISENEFESLIADCIELIRILISIIKKLKEN